jgi:2-haloacid dehalogenase
VIETVIFDLGGVLLDWNPRYLYRKLFDDEQAMERFLNEVCTIEWHSQLDLGVPADQACEQLIADHPELADLIRAWVDRSEEMISGPIEGTVEILRELKQRGVPCYALTNMEAYTYPRRLERYEFLRWFDGTVVSSLEGVIKPDPEIFTRLLTRYDLTPAKTLFIDDSARNVEAAAKLGIDAIRFQTPAELRAELTRRALL